MNQLLLAGLAGTAIISLAGCNDPGWGWKRTDGQSARNDPALHARFEADKSTCVAEMQKAGLSGSAGDRGGALQASRRIDALDSIRDCMAQRGYVAVPKSQLEAAR